MHSNDKNPSCRLAACTPRDENGGDSSPSVIPDVFNRESSVFSFPFVPEETTLDSRFRRNDRRKKQE